jgi:hypothetical protein
MVHGSHGLSLIECVLTATKTWKVPALPAGASPEVIAAHHADVTETRAAIEGMLGADEAEEVLAFEAEVAAEERAAEEEEAALRAEEERATQSAAGAYDRPLYTP